MEYNELVKTAKKVNEDYANLVNDAKALKKLLDHVSDQLKYAAKNKFDLSMAEKTKMRFQGILFQVKNEFYNLQRILDELKEIDTKVEIFIGMFIRSRMGRLKQQYGRDVDVFLSSARYSASDKFLALQRFLPEEEKEALKEVNTIKYNLKKYINDVIAEGSEILASLREFNESRGEYQSQEYAPLVEEISSLRSELQKKYAENIKDLLIRKYAADPEELETLSDEDVMDVSPDEELPEAEIVEEELVPKDVEEEVVVPGEEEIYETMKPKSSSFSFTPKEEEYLSDIRRMWKVLEKKKIDEIVSDAHDAAQKLLKDVNKIPELHVQIAQTIVKMIKMINMVKEEIEEYVAEGRKAGTTLYLKAFVETFGRKPKEVFRSLDLMIQRFQSDLLPKEISAKIKERIKELENEETVVELTEEDMPAQILPEEERKRKINPYERQYSFASGWQISALTNFMKVANILKSHKISG